MKTLATILQSTERLSSATPEALAACQRERLNALVAYAREHSPFYARWYRGLPSRIRDLRELPPVTKGDLMAHFDEVVTDPEVREVDVRRHLADVEQVGHPFLGRYLLWRSSGTTGTPSLTLADHQWDQATTALNIVRLGKAWYGPEVVQRMQALGGVRAHIFTDRAHSMGGTQLTRQRRQNPHLAERLRLVPITLPLPVMVEVLNALQPASVTGYAAALEALAVAQLEGRLRIQPAVVVSTGERLRPEARARMAQAFGVPPRNLYGTTEAGLVGFECAHGRLHLNADWSILEPVRRDHTPSDPHAFSERTLVTNLANRVLPVIRCELNDQLQLRPGPCPCGLTLPQAELLGRADDVLWVPDKDGRRVPLLPLAVAAAIQQTLGIARFQVLQTGPAQLTVRLQDRQPEASDANWCATVTHLNAYLKDQGATGIELVRGPVPPEADPVSGKFRETWRTCDLPDLP